MVESLVLVEGEEGQALHDDALRDVSLSNAKQVVVGRTPKGQVILHVAANALDDLREAFLGLAEAPGVGNVVIMTLRSGGARESPQRGTEVRGGGT